MMVKWIFASIARPTQLGFLARGYLSYANRRNHAVSRFTYTNIGRDGYGAIGYTESVVEEKRVILTDSHYRLAVSFSVAAAAMLIGCKLCNVPISYLFSAAF
jgi:hypothetical protein